jgi:hypothetical protein
MISLHRKWYLLIFLLTVQQSWASAWQETRKTLVPGVVHLAMYDPHAPRSMNVLEIDLSAPNVRLTSVKALNLLQGNEPTSKQILRWKQTGTAVVAAVNADFYGLNGVPVGIQVIEGVPLKDPSLHSIFALTKDKVPRIEVVSLAGEIRLDPFNALPIHGINRIRSQDEIILYNHFRGPTTNSNHWGLEITLHFLTPFVIGEVVKSQVVSVAQAGNQPIPAFGGAVLSAHGKFAKQLQKQLRLQDSVSLQIKLPPIDDPVELAVGGLPRIIRDGKISIEIIAESVPTHFSTTRHPRTAVGYSRDEKTLFLVTVDGRQPNFSIGMTLPELANFMVQLGCYQALNLDGGGSTTMVIGDKVMNSPSDPTGERAVANALLVISKNANTK